MPIDVLTGARADLTALKQADPNALAVVTTFLEEAEADPEIIYKCTTHGDIEIGPYRVNAKRWIKASRSDNLFRFRILDTPATDYRIVYGYDWHTRRIGILAVVHKDNFDYAITGKLADRIQNDWGIATGGRST